MKGRYTYKAICVNVLSGDTLTVMIDLGFKFISVSSDFRIMSTYANSIIEEIKDKKKSKSSNSAY